MTIDKGLSFRVEATPHEGIGSKGLSVKVKVRQKKDAGTQYDTILKIQKAASHDKSIHLVQSEQTMTSFDMLVEKQKPIVKKKGSFFRNFKPGGCLDPPLDEDRHTYRPKKAATPKTATPNPSKSSSSLDYKKTCKYKKHGTTCVKSKKEEKEHPIEKSSSASVMSLFKDVPASFLNTHSSNTIITYPIHAKRSKVSTTSSKKSMDEKRKKSFSQTTELYFKPKGNDTGINSPSHVSKKRFSREGHRSVDSDTLPYIQDVAKAQMPFIEDDTIFPKQIPQPVIVSDVEVQDDNEIIAHFENNKRNEMLTGHSTTLSNSIIKPLHDETITTEKADYSAIASAARLTVAGLAAAGLTDAVIKQQQEEKDFNETDGAVVSKKEDQTLKIRNETVDCSVDKQIKEENVSKEDSFKEHQLKRETPMTDLKFGIPKLGSHIIDKAEDTKDLIQTDQPQIIENSEKQTALSKKASNQDMKSTSILSKNDAITSRSQESRDISDSANDAKFIEISKETPDDVLKSKPELEPIEKTSISTTHNDDNLFDRKNIAPPFKVIEKQHNKEDSKRDYTESKAGVDEVFPNTENKEVIKDGSSDKILQTKPTESLRQEHDNNVAIILDVPRTEEATEEGRDLVTLTSIQILEVINKDGAQKTSQSKTASVVFSAKDINEQSVSKLVAGSRLPSQSQIRKISSSGNEMADKNSKVNSSPHELYLTQEGKKSSAQNIAANMFPLHKASSSYSSEHGDFLITRSPLNSSIPDSEKQTVHETALATEAEIKSKSDAKIIDIESQLVFEPQTDFLGSKTSTTALHQETENNLRSLLDATSSFLSTTADKALSTFDPPRSYSGDASTKLAKRGSLRSTTANKELSTFVPQRSYSGDESTKMAIQGSLEGSENKGLDLPYIRASFDKEVNTESQPIFMQDPVSQELASLDKFIRNTDSQLESGDDNIIVTKKSLDISARDSTQSVKHQQGSTLLQKPITDKVGFTEKPVFEPGYSQGIEPVTVVRSVTSIKDGTGQNMVLNDFTPTAESAKTLLRTGQRPSRDSITSSLAPSIDIDQTDQFLVDIAFKFSRNGAAKHTIIKSVDAESTSNQISRLNNIISHKSISNPFEHPIEIRINPEYYVSRKLNPKHKIIKEKRKTENKHSRSSLDITSKLLNTVQKHNNIESKTRRKGVDINIVLETIYKEKLQPLERNIKKLKAEILLLTQEQAYIQRYIHNFTEKGSSLRTNRVKRSISCLCKRNIPNAHQYTSVTMQ